jgi:nicotinate-nucleotide adenylyltransferase
MIGLFFGTFDPVHVGHMIVAEYMLRNENLEEVWFMVSPHNPHKDPKQMLNQYERLYMVNIAVEDVAGFKASNFEFDLPKPSYTIDTLRALRNSFPDKDFALILGADSLNNLPRWKMGADILNEEKLLVYPRPGSFPSPEHYDRSNIKLTNAPLVDISSSAIRRSIRSNKPLSQMIPEKVWNYIDKQLLYK